MNINIVIPMAGRGSRFKQAGCNTPKPLIEVRGMPMIELVIRNLMPKRYIPKFIFICQEEHLRKSDLGERIRTLTNNFEIISINFVTGGAAETVLLAKDFIDNEDHLMIANCDQYVDIIIDDYIDNICFNDGGIMTMFAEDPKWSYIKYERDKIVDVVEKEVVSNDATVGIYNFSKGEDFVSSAELMIKKNLKVNGEFYVAPVYKQMIEKGMQISTYDISGKMYGIGTPEDLKSFQKINDLMYLPEPS